MDPYLATLNELFTTTYRSVLKVEEVMLRHLSNGSLTLSEMHMLECIGKRAGDAAITDIAQELDVTPPSVTMAVKRLEKKGFLTKARSEEDGRRVRVRLNRGRPPRRDRPPLLSPPDGARRVARPGTGPARGPALRSCGHQRIHAPESRRIRRREEGKRMRILGTGSALPAHTLTNDDLSKFLDTSDEWIRTHTGIRSRQVITDETLLQLAARAANAALENAGLVAADIDYILASSVLPDTITPSLGCLLQAEIGADCPRWT